MTQKHEFLDLKQRSMLVAAYKAKFHVLYHYVTQLEGIEKERTQIFLIGLNIDLQVLSIHMTFVGKSFNKVSSYVKKLEGFKKVGRAKALA